MPKIVEKDKALSIMRSLRISPELNNWLIKYCQERQADESDIIRQLIKALKEKEINPMLISKQFKKDTKNA